MELANLWRGADATAVIRNATEADAADIFKLLHRAPYSHTHVGWHLPAQWLGRPEFLVCERPAHRSPAMRKMWGEEPTLQACLVAAANPAPVAWVHVAAVSRGLNAVAALAAMLAQLEELLWQTAVTQIAWMPVDDWPQEWLSELGFVEVNQVQTYLKRGMDLPEIEPVVGLTIRPATTIDIPTLAQLEADTFVPLWRHSLADLSIAQEQAFSFDVALLNGEIVGFQASTCQADVAHLARLTVASMMQGQGVGTALLAHAIQSFADHLVRSVSLNTQVDNLPSQYLYEKFGFVAQNQWFSIWTKQI